MQIKFFGTLYLELKRGEIELKLDQPKSIKNLLQDLSSQLGPQFHRKLFQNHQLRQGVIILKNGANILHLQGLDTVIKDEDTLAIFPPGGGG